MVTAIIGAIATLIEEIPAILQFLSAIGSLVKTAWAAYQSHRIEIASDEAAAKLKASAITARSGDTSDLEKWFNPTRTYEKTPASNPPTPNP